jgi:hypothetical protein
MGDEAGRGTGELMAEKGWRAGAIAILDRYHGTFDIFVGST